MRPLQGARQTQSCLLRVQHSTGCVGGRGTRRPRDAFCERHAADWPFQGMGQRGTGNACHMQKLHACAISAQPEVRDDVYPGVPMHVRPSPSAAHGSASGGLEEPLRFFHLSGPWRPDHPQQQLNDIRVATTAMLAKTACSPLLGCRPAVTAHQ